MTNEIKKILSYLKKKENTRNIKCITLSERDLLLDYITNLQTIEQQYSAILSENAELENKITNLQEENKLHNKILKDANDVLNIQAQEGNYNYDSYMLGLYNGMEMIVSLFEQREPKFKCGKDIKFLHERDYKEKINDRTRDKVRPNKKSF